MKAGAKAAVDDSVLPGRPRSVGSARFGKFCERFIKVPKGTGARSPLKLRPWQRDLVGSVLDADPQARTAGWMLPRGQGKSSLMGAVPSPLGARAAVIAADLTEVADALLAYGGNPLRSM